MPDTEKRFQKVATFQIAKPVNMTWDELGKILRNVRYCLFRLANMAIAEYYLNFHQKIRMKYSDTDENRKLKNINRKLRQMLIEEYKKRNQGISENELSKYCRDGAVSGYICGAFEKIKLSSIKSKSKWRKVITGENALPVFKRDIAIPINCSDHNPSIIEKTETEEYQVDLRICQKPYPRVTLSTAKISDGQKVVLERLVANRANLPEGYRHRFFEIVEKPKRRWNVHVIYDFPKSESGKLHSDIIVGVDLGWSVPLYAAINNGYARIGYRKLRALGDKIKSLQRQTISRRRSILRTGSQDLSGPTARSGHGRNRLLMPIKKLENKIDNAYTTLNHQLSHCVIEFAKNNGAGLIHIEKLKGLSEELTGTFLGMNWRREQLQRFIKYKAEQAGIYVKEVNPCYTSRRCSKCGFINKDFDSEYRKRNRKNGKSTMFKCPKCEYEENADYNAARNLATNDIENKIRLQCESQGIEYKELEKE